MSDTDPTQPRERSGDAWLLCSSEGAVLEASDDLLSLLGFGSVPEFQEAVPRIQDLYGSHADRAVLTPPLASSLVADEVRWIRRDGTSLWVRLRTEAEGSSQGAGSPATPEDLSLKVRVEDVTGRQHLEDQLRQARKMEALGQLAGGLANDLNDFLTAILAHVDLLEEGLSGEERERVQHDIREIRRTATTSAQMVKHLLSVSRGERIRLQTVLLQEVVRDAMRLVRPLLPSSVEVDVVLEDLEPALADPAALEQMVLTLAGNARDAMPGGGRLEITVSGGGFDEEHLSRTGWGDPGDYGVVTLKDNGVGMTPRTVARLFQPFFSANLTGESPGLSMAMVYGLMKQHRGFIQVESEPGSGTTVRLYFRLVRGRSRPSAESLEDASQGGASVLFVEDDESLRRVTSRILRSRGYRVMEAANGIEALEVMEKEGDPDLLIVDLIMPSMTGAELLERLRSERRPLRVLLTSGFRPEFLMGWDQVDPSEHPFLEKPWQVETLLDMVASALEG